jgi:hypothetical protein
MDMHFWMGVQDLPHKYQTVDSLWTALSRFAKGRESPGSLMNQAVLASTVVPSSFCELWDANIPSPCAQCARFLVDGNAGSEELVEELPRGCADADYGCDAEEPLAGQNIGFDFDEVFFEADEYSQEP